MIQYFGNNLKQHGYTPTAMELLIPHLKKKYVIGSSSSLKNPIFRMLNMVWFFFRHKKETRLVLIDTYSTWAFYYALVIALLSNLFSKSYIPIVHGGNISKRIEKYPRFTNYLFRNSYINVSPSLYLYSIFQNNGFDVLYIPNFININQYPYLERKNITPKLLWVRSFHQIYNPIMAVQVLSKLKKIFSEAELCMVGPFKDNSIYEVRKIVQDLLITDNIQITGKLEKHEWIELSKSYNIFINTTNIDNQPLSLIESMALGLAIVSTNAGGLPHLLAHDKTGKLVNCSDVSGMVKEIVDYLKNEDKRLNITQNARIQVEKNYSEINVIIKWYSLIDSILTIKRTSF